MAGAWGYSSIPRSDLPAIKNAVGVLIGEIKRQRIKRGLSQEEFAEKMNISVGMVKAMEQGTRVPSLPMLMHIGKKVGLSLVFDAG